MNRNIFYIYALCCVLALTGCWEDRSWQYYEKVQTKTWMYETMQKNYLFYEDLPVLDPEDKIFFKQPDDFLHSVASDKDGKAGYIFSHIDSIGNFSRAMSEVPGFGYEGAFVNVRFANELVPAIRVLYVQKDSPAEKNGFRRGDWIVTVDSMGIKSEQMGEYTDRPSGPHTFQMAEINAEQTGFDTLATVITLTPELVDEKDVLYDGVVTSDGGHRAYYILYNHFGKDYTEWKAVFQRMAAATFEDVIVDLRYNPGGYMSTLEYVATNLAPEECMGEVFAKLIPAEGLGLKTSQFSFNSKLLEGGSPLPYRNLYVIATVHSASASESFINCMRPYVPHFYHVGMNTYGKNVAQALYQDEKLAAGLEFWLTTYYTANRDDFYDFYTSGLKPDCLRPENLGGELGEFATPADSLLQPVLYHMDNNHFEETAPSVQEGKSRSAGRGIQWEVICNSIDRKEKNLIIK